MRQLLTQSNLNIKLPLKEEQLISPFENSQEEEFFSLSIKSRLTIEEEKSWFYFCRKLNPDTFSEEFKEYDEKKAKMYNLVNLFTFISY